MGSTPCRDQSCNFGTQHVQLCSTILACPTLCQHHCSHLMQISYADTPGPTVTLEEGKSFPFYHQLQVRNANGSILYPTWQLWGSFQPLSASDATNCPEILLQEGGQDPNDTGAKADQGDHLVRGDSAMTAVMTTLRGKGRDLQPILPPPY